MSLFSVIRAWSERRRQRAVLRRLAKLDAQISAAEAQLKEAHDHHSRCATIFSSEIHAMSALAGKVAYLKRIRAHNFQHEDVL